MSRRVRAACWASRASHTVTVQLTPPSQTAGGTAFVTGNRPHAARTANASAPRPPSVAPAHSNRGGPVPAGGGGEPTPPDEQADRRVVVQRGALRVQLDDDLPAGRPRGQDRPAEQRGEAAGRHDRGPEPTG